VNKILVSIYVLAIDEWIDVFLPVSIYMYEAIELIQNVIKENSSNNYVCNEEALLYSCENGKVINKNNIVKFSGLKNGSRVILK